LFTLWVVNWIPYQAKGPEVVLLFVCKGEHRIVSHWGVSSKLTIKFELKEGALRLCDINCGDDTLIELLSRAVDPTTVWY